MKPTLSFLTALLLAPLAALRAADAPKPEAKPNIIVILADDLGWGDVGCYGATKIRTPHIDRLAREGMKFTDAHTAASFCSPSRYGLMTGRYPWRLHLKGNDYSLEPGRLTMASMLKTQGYRSAAIGKWHLGYSKEWNQPPITGPLEAGFDYHFGVPMNHNDPYRAYIENHDIVGRKPGEAFRVVKGRDFPEGLAQPRVDDQVSETLVGKALHFIEENRERPFFLYFTSVVPHTHITPAARFRGTSQAGLYGDYIQELDENVGRILDSLDRLQLAGRTLVFFASDNGGTPLDFKGTHDTKLNLASEAGGVREKVRTAKGDARAMGHITNGPWHDGKSTPYEGGHRVPFIARWPGRITPGTSSDQLLCLTDLLATAADIVETKLPKDAGEDSFSFLPGLLGRPGTGVQRKTAFIQGDQYDNAIAVRAGPWKLIETTNNRKQKVHQLYDLTSDPGETNDIAKSKPEVVQELAAALQKARTDGRTRN
jgi:arylsulfatase A